MGRVATNEKLNEKILVDLKAGKPWKEIRDKHGVDNAYINSVQGTHRDEIYRHKIETGYYDTEEIYYKGVRIHDGKYRPVKKFNINDLTDEELERMGLLKYKKTS